MASPHQDFAGSHRLQTYVGAAARCFLLWQPEAPFDDEVASMCWSFPAKHGESSETQAAQGHQDYAAGFRNGLARQAERCVERREWSASDNVLADPKPVWSQVFIPNPGLEVSKAGGERGSRRNDWPGCREPEEIAAARQLNLGDKEIMVFRKKERRGEDDVELNLLPGDRALAHGVEVGLRMDPIQDRVAGGERRLDDPRCEREGVRGSAPVVEFDI